MPVKKFKVFKISCSQCLSRYIQQWIAPTQTAIGYRCRIEYRCANSHRRATTCSSLVSSSFWLGSFLIFICLAGGLCVRHILVEQSFLFAVYPTVLFSPSGLTIIRRKRRPFSTIKYDPGNFEIPLIKRGRGVLGNH